MQPIANSSLTSAGNLPAAAPLSPNAGAATDGQGAPAFAQVVRDVFNRDTAASSKSPGTQAPATSRTKVSAKGTALRHPLQSNKSLPPTTIAFFVAPPVSPASLLNLLGISPAAVQGLQPTLEQAVPDDGVAKAADVGKPARPLVGEITDRTSQDVGALAQSSGQILVDRVAAQSSVAAAALIPSSETSVTIPSGDTPSSDGVKTFPDPATIGNLGTLPIGTSAIDAPGVTLAATPAVTTAAIPAAPTVVESAVAPLVMPVVSPQTTVPALLIGEGTVTPATGGERVASLLAQISRVQGNTSAARTHLFSTASTFPRLPALHLPTAPQTQGLARIVPPVAASRPPAIPVLPTAAKGSQPVVNASRTPVPAKDSTSASNENDSSQDSPLDRKDSGHTDSPAAADASSSTPAVHDATSFSQAAVVATSDKQDVSPTPDASAPPDAASAPASPPEHSASSLAPAPQATPTSAAPTLPPQNADGTSTRVMDSAKLVEAAGRSEMRIAMDTDKLGPVELRAHMVGDEVGAAITVEKRDAHAALAVELPALQQALSDKQLRVEQVTLLHASLGSTAGDAGASTKQEQRSGAHAATTPWSGSSGGVVQSLGNAAQSGIFDAKGRLSVHA
jgi:flagellar hook-length control protein FliK